MTCESSAVDLASKDDDFNGERDCCRLVDSQALPSPTPAVLPRPLPWYGFPSEPFGCKED